MALGFMRRHRRWLYGFLWLVIAAFIILYIPAFQGADAGSPGETLARVGDLPITVGEFQKAYLRQRQAFERLYQGRLDPAALRSLGLEQQVFEGLVAERLVLLEARRLGLTVDDRTLARSLQTAPDLQEDGKFIGAAELRRRLELQGVSLPDFEESRRTRLLADRLEALVTAGVSVTPAEAEREYRRRNEQVRIEYVRVDAEPFRAGIGVSDDEVRTRFQERRESYRIPEKRVVSYVLVDPEALAGRVTITDRDLEAYYQEQREDFKEEEQACARHILVKVKSGPESTEGHPEEEARRIAQGLLDALRAGGDFAALAKKASEDRGSADRGGDLGCFPRGRMVPEFDNEAFSLEPGQLSGLVRTPFGYHAIRLDSRREETIPALSEVKERIRQIVRGERVRALVEEAVGSLSASLRRGRSLEEAAREQGLTAQNGAPMARGEGVPPLESPVLAARAFRMEVGEIDREPFPLPRGYAFIALAEVQPSRIPELAEARQRVRADLVEERALEAARARAGALRAQAQTAGLEKAASALGLVRKETPALVGRGQELGDLGAGLALEQAAYALPEKALSDPARVAGGYAILRVLEKKPFDPVAFERQRPALLAELREQKRAQFFQAYLSQARQRFPVERRPEAFRRVLG